MNTNYRYLSFNLILTYHGYELIKKTTIFELSWKACEYYLSDFVLSLTKKSGFEYKL